MTLYQLIEQHKGGIVDRWWSLVLDTYPAETAQILKTEDDRFANPVAFNTKSNLVKLLGYLVGSLDMENAIESLKEIVKIRAVQDFSPAEAVSFIWLLKKAVQDVLPCLLSREDLHKDWLEFELKVDDLTGQAFNAYMACKEKIYQIRLRELRSEGNVLMRMQSRQGS